MKIKRSKPYIEEDDVLAVAEAVKSGMHGRGEVVERFEKKMSKLVGAKYARATTSGTTALHLALLSLGVGECDEVIMPSYVCHTVMGAVYHSRAKPVLADIDDEFAQKGCNVSARTIKKLINKKTKAIIVPHMFGIPAEIDEIIEFGVPLIEDCGGSLGTKYKGGMTGGIGKIGIFSFYATKTITTGQGGMIVTSSDEIFDKINDLTEYDQREYSGIAYNYELTNIQAALGISQLVKLEKFILRRKEIASRYDEAFGKLNISLFPRVEESYPYRYLLKFKDSKQREFVEKRLKEEDIGVDRPVFRPLHRYLGLDKEKFKNSEEAHETILSIPVYPSLKDAEVKRIIDELKKCF